MNWIKRKITETIIVSISIIFTLALFEGFLVLENKSKPVERTKVEIKGYTYPFIQNSVLPNIFKEENEQNELFVIGDSFVEGVTCAADEENFPSHLSKMLPGKTKIINLGVNGMNPADYIDFLDELKISTGDSVLITLYDNDIHVSPKNCQQIIRQSKDFGSFLPASCIRKDGIVIDKSNESIAQKINNNLIHFKVIQLLKETAVQIPVLSNQFYRTEYRNRWTDFEVEENKWILSSLNVMKEIVELKGGAVYFTYYPNTNRISAEDRRHSKWLQFINYAMQKHGIIISDPYPYIVRKAKSSSMVWSLTDKHPSCEAHKLMAAFTTQDLREHLLPNQ